MYYRRGKDVKLPVSSSAVLETPQAVFTCILWKSHCCAFWIDSLKECVHSQQIWDYISEGWMFWSRWVYYVMVFYLCSFFQKAPQKPLQSYQVFYNKLINMFVKEWRQNTLKMYSLSLLRKKTKNIDDSSYMYLSNQMLSRMSIALWLAMD